jgi:hypothetical protein
MRLRSLALTLVLPLAPLLLATPARAVTATYVAANAQGCRVWAPLQHPSPNYKPQYTGACKDGFASGKGHLDWVNTYASNRVTATWDGYFLNGVFTGPSPLAATIEPQPNSNDYWVHLAAIPAGDITLIARTNDAGILNLCLGPTIALTASPRLSLTDDTAVQRAMSDAAAKLLPLCKTGFTNTSQVNVYNVPYQLDASRHYPQSIASARIDWSNLQPTSYNNSASASLHQQQRFAAADARDDANRKRFDDFTARNHISTWVTAQQLSANPFKYQGKTVGIIVQLDRMLSPTVALVSGALEDDGGSLQLHNITPDFPDSNHSVLLAVRAGPRETLVGTTGPAETTSVTRIDSVTCTQSSCLDWTTWARGKLRIPWGEPYTPTP